MWRSAFKKEMYEAIDALYFAVVSKDGYDKSRVEPFAILHQIVKKDCIDAASFDMKTQADLMSLMTDNLETLEKVVFALKAMLKEPNPELFNEKKIAMLAKLSKEQKEFKELKKDD